MATLLLDFDSTIISCESLEEIIRAQGCTPAHLKSIKEMTNLGMSGGVDSLVSLQKRLELFPINKQAVQMFGRTVHRYLTPGMAELIEKAKKEAIDIWIISGAMREVIAPMGALLGIPESNIRGVELKWKENGDYSGIDSQKPFNRSKCEGVQHLERHLSAPVIAVGDGMSDYALYEAGVAEYFVAFTQHVRRAAVVLRSDYEAHSIEELDTCLFSRILKKK